MTDSTRILLPIEILEGNGIPTGVPELLAPATVVLLGYHEIPEQTAPGQARMQFEEQARARLTEIATIFESAGSTVDSVLVFTHDPQQTIDRIIYEEDCVAVLIPGTIGQVEDVFVPVRGNVGVDRLVEVVTGLFAGTNTKITVFHIASEAESDEEAEDLLNGIRAGLLEGGIESNEITTRIERTNQPVARVIEETARYDVVVLGETSPSVVTYVFGMGSEQISDRFLGPVLVVQRERHTD